MQDLIQYITPTLLFPLAFLFFLLAFFSRAWTVLFPRRTLPQGGEDILPVLRPPMTFSAPLHPMERRDLLPLLLLTAVYAVTAFWHLGSTVAPQSFESLGDREPHVITLSQEVYVTKFRYYPGLGTGKYNLEISSDGEHWSTLWTQEDENGETSYYWADAAGYEPSYALAQNYDDLFKWLEITPTNPQNVRYLRITGRGDKLPLELGELALYTSSGRLELSSTGDGAITVQGCEALFDEPDTVPEESSFFNSSYFDEIYHPRTAYEHVRGVYPYELSHPPLGKLIISLGIRLFGMTPFGWRFMGTLFGVLMLPLLYLFLKNLFGKTPLAFCGTALFAFDFMHLVQTRLATIDTYAVFFILAMYYFLYRWLALPAGTPFRRGALPLLLSGCMFGIGAASKWTVLYGGAGMAILYFINLYFKHRDWPWEESEESFSSWAWKNILFSVLCFVAIPVVIYVASYLPYAQARGDTSLSNLLAIVWDNQKFMFNYHKGVTADHPYASQWWQWILDIRPILYYREYLPGGLKSAFSAFSNPAIAWGGLLALIVTLFSLVRRRSGIALFILIGYLAQLVPWIPITRPTFAYHYFPATLFLVLALSYVFNQLMEALPAGRWRRPIYGFTGVTAGLYFLFYPELVGIPIPTWFSTAFLQWLPSWPI